MTVGPGDCTWSELLAKEKFHCWVSYKQDWPLAGGGHLCTQFQENRCTFTMYIPVAEFNKVCTQLEGKPSVQLPTCTCR